MKLRLNKFIAESGITSRRKADELISDGKIKVNGEVATELGTQVDPEIDIVEYDGKKIKPQQKLVYYALNKPVGIISTRSDEQGRESVTDLVPSDPPVYPVGRLDADSEGLIILTNDGELTQKLTHPSFQHEKEYEVTASKLPDYSLRKIIEIKKQFENGIYVDDIIMKVDSVSDLKEHQQPWNHISFRLILHTGYNRQIRKMCGRIGLSVNKLKRVRIGKLTLGNLNLKPGKYREIKKSDILL